MNKTGIEWVRNPDGSQGYTWNPISGCLNHDNGLCKGGGFPCYAYKLANGRLQNRYLSGGGLPPHSNFNDYFEKPFYPRFWGERLEAMNPVGKLKYFPVGGGSKVQPKGIFVCDMGDLFGEGIPYKWTAMVLDVIKFNPNHRFYLLTKQPQNLFQFSPFSENCWVGVTATNEAMFNTALWELSKIKATVRYISIEPFLGYIPAYLESLPKRYEMVDWLIIGACTGNMVDMAWLGGSYTELNIMPWGKKFTAQPRIEWVKEIVKAADQASIPVFLKDNLRPLLDPYNIDRELSLFKVLNGQELRQELPKEVVANCPL